MKALRVLHVIPSMGMGGAERMVVDLIRTLHPTIDFHVCCVQSAQWYYDELPIRPPAELRHRGTWRSPFALRKTTQRLRAVIRDFAPDVIHSHLWFADFVSALANKERLPHIVHLHNTSRWKISSRFGFRLRRSLYSGLLRRRCARFVSPSYFVADWHARTLGIAASRLTVIPYGVDTARFVPGDLSGGKECIHIGSVGRFVPMKGHVTLLRAIPKIKASTTFRVVLYGDGPLRPTYESVLDELKLGDIVFMPGAITNVSEAYRDLDIYVQPSREEALPIAVLEAMAAGLPIIGTRIAGIPEQVEDGVNGFLVEPDCPDTLASAIKTLIDSPGLCIRFGQASRDKATTEFSLDKMCSRIAALYREVAETRNKQSIPPEGK